MLETNNVSQPTVKSVESNLKKPLLVRHFPLFVALTFFWSLVVGITLSILRQNDNHLVYAIDDAYIHLAVAKNLAQHGVWGVTPYEFSSSSSSLLWTLLLTTLSLFFGANELLPLILNVIFGSLIVVLVYFNISRYKVSNFYKSLTLLAVIILTPLLPLIFSGMEHVLQSLISVGFCFTFGQNYY